MSFSPLTFFRAPAAEQLSCSTSELSLFTRQLSTLINAGVPLVSSLETLSQGEDPLSSRVVPILARRVAQGIPFSTALRSFPRIFPMTYVSLIRGSEETGTLHKNLDYLADWLERHDKILRHVKRAMTYPVLVIVVTFILTMALFRTVVPKILEAVLDMGAALPAPTRLLLVMVEVVKSPWAWLASVLVILAVVGYLRSPQGWRTFTGILVGAPGIGSLLRCAASARLSLTLSMLLAAGSEVMRACGIAGSSSGLPQFHEDADRIRAELREGRFLSQAYNGSALYPPLLCDLLRAGEESGKLAPMLQHAATLFEEETYGRLETLTNLLEPLALAFISLGVGFVLIGVVMPMTTMLSAL